MKGYARTLNPRGKSKKCGNLHMYTRIETRMCVCERMCTYM